MEQSKDQNQQQIQANSSPEILRGQYATAVEVKHSSEEFLLDFINQMPPAQHVGRIILSPSHFKRFARAVEDNLKKYEEQYGVIQLQVVPDMKIDFGDSQKK